MRYRSQMNVAGLQRYVDQQKAEAEETIAKFREAVAEPETHICWAVRGIDNAIYAGVLLRRMHGLQQAITRYQNSVEGKIDPAPLTKECGGELTEQSFCEHVVDNLTQRLVERARYMSSGLETQAERNAEVEILARLLDEGQYRWYVAGEATAS